MVLMTFYSDICGYGMEKNAHQVIASPVYAIWAESGKRKYMFIWN